jgi:hypothetical protein
MKFNLCAFTIVNVTILLVNIACTAAPNVGGPSVLAQAEPQPKGAREIEATEFRVVDKDGNVRIRLTCDKDGHPTMTMMKADRKQGVRLRVISDGPELELFGEGAETAWLYCRGSEPALSLSDKAGFTRANMWLDKGTPRLELQRGRGSSIDETAGLAQLAVSPEGGSLRLLGNGKESSKLKVKAMFGAGINESGNAVAEILNEDKKLIWQAP